MNTEGIPIGTEKSAKQERHHLAMLNAAQYAVGLAWIFETKLQPCKLKFFTLNPAGINTRQTNFNTAKSVPVPQLLLVPSGIFVPANTEIPS